MSCQIVLIAAFGNHGQVGLGNALPWNLPKELAHFRETTQNHPIIMGRKTFESIGHPLPNRKNIVVSNSLPFLPGVQVETSVTKAISALSAEHDRVFVIGGSKVWQEALPIAHNLVLSEINYDGEADVSLPASFFLDIRSNFRIHNLRHNEEFTVSYWYRKKPLS